MSERLNPGLLKSLRRNAREAARTYVGTHWPSMEDMRHDGMGFHLVEDRAHDPIIRRFLATWSPEFALDILDALAAVPAHTAGALDVERLERGMQAAYEAKRQPGNRYHRAYHDEHGDWCTPCPYEELTPAEIAKAYEAASPSEDAQ